MHCDLEVDCTSFAFVVATLNYYYVITPTDAAGKLIDRMSMNLVFAPVGRTCSGSRVDAPAPVDGRSR